MSAPSPTAQPAETARSESNLSFIEVQFPVSKLSKESYKERMAGHDQTLTVLGKWWGRKPLVLVRAIILGLLLPATDDPEGDRQTFLTLMTMDDDGLWQRLKSSISVRDVHKLSTPREREECFTDDGTKPGWRRGLGKEEQRHMMRRAFLRMNYDQKLTFCKRPEEIAGPSVASWMRINEHLGTHAENLPELIGELGKRRFGGVPHIGDVFSGGGSIPFEAARIGCEAFGSDLNPVAGLLTWAALNVMGGGGQVIGRISEAQHRVYDSVQTKVDAWGIERNVNGWIADTYLYCNEVLDPTTGWYVPLAPSWMIAPKYGVVGKLVPDQENRRFLIEIHEHAGSDLIDSADAEGTARNGIRCPVDREGRWLQPSQRQATTVERLRGAQGLRLWAHDDLVPRSSDVFQERLYCIRWIDPATGTRHYRAPTLADLEREDRVLDLINERFRGWQATGILPVRAIERGQETDRPMRERGWTHWHHLFNPRQLLLTGLFAEEIMGQEPFDAAALLPLLGRITDRNSRLCLWDDYQAHGAGGSIHTFYNQALNTLYNYGCRAMSALNAAFCIDIAAESMPGRHTVVLSDARQVEWPADIWITDPGYGDVILYDELSEFFLAWYDRILIRSFPSWYSDSKRAFTVKGEGADFRTILAECYRHTTKCMRADGFQVVMFTHQDPEVWADLTLVLWDAGLHVSAAWTIATETSGTGIKQGNYVQGTVILVLRKRQGNERGELSDIFPDVQTEVRRQVRTMLALDPKDDPNFGDADYQLAAYAAALRVLTGYASIGDIDVERELRRTRQKGEISPVTTLIERAVRIASDELVPAGLEAAIWRKLGPEERLYLKGIAVEARGDSREGVYQELARGYGATDFRQMLASRTANKARLKTPSEFAARDLRTPLEGGFAGSLLRYVLYAVYTVAQDAEQGPRAARTYLRQEWPDYWNARVTIIGLLRYLTATPTALPHWAADLKAAQLLLGSVENDSL